MHKEIFIDLDEVEGASSGGTSRSIGLSVRLSGDALFNFADIVDRGVFVIKQVRSLLSAALIIW